MACRRGENVLFRVWLNIGDLACLATASYNGLQIACGRVGTTACCPVADVVVNVIMPEVVAMLEDVLHVPDGVGGAGGVGTECCENNQKKISQS